LIKTKKSGLETVSSPLFFCEKTSKNEKIFSNLFFENTSDFVFDYCTAMLYYI